MKKKSYVKSTIEKGRYPSTVVYSEIKKPKYKDTHYLLLWWVIDTGKHLGFKLSQSFPCTDLGVRRLETLSDRLNLIIRGKIKNPITFPIFPLQFIGLRSLLTIDNGATTGGHFVKNYIIRNDIATGLPQENVLKPNSISHFYQEKQGRKLPLTI